MSIRHDIEDVVGKGGTLIAICSSVEGLIDVSNEQRLTSPRRLQQLLRARRNTLHDEWIGPLIHEGVVYRQREGVLLKHCGGASCNPVALVLADIALSHVSFQLLLLQDIVRRRGLDSSYQRIHNVNEFLCVCVWCMYMCVFLSLSLFSHRRSAFIALQYKLNGRQDSM